MERDTQDIAKDGSDAPELLPASVGERLRAERERQGLDLNDIATTTRIPLRHLEVIERGAFGDLPSRTYAIGFSRSYAQALKLNENEITDAVREELSVGSARHGALLGDMEPGDPAKLPSRGLAWFGAAAAAILAFGIFSFYGTYFGAGDGPAPLVADDDGDDAGNTGEGAFAAAEPDQDGPINAGGQVVFTALEDGVWARFYEDQGDPFFEAQMASGDTFQVPADAQNPLINTGRPDAFAITIGGREVPKLANAPITMGDTPISARALLARADTPLVAGPSTNLDASSRAAPTDPLPSGGAETDKPASIPQQSEEPQRSAALPSGPSVEASAEIVEPPVTSPQLPPATEQIPTSNDAIEASDDGAQGVGDESAEESANESTDDGASMSAA